MPAAHSLHILRGHAPRRTDVAPGLEVSLRNILQDLLVQRQLRHQSLQLAVLFLQFLQPLRLVHLQPAVFLSPAVERLHGDGGLFAGLWSGFSVRDADFNLPQHRHDLLWFVPLDGHDLLFLQVDSLSFHLVQISPVRSQYAPRDCLELMDEKWRETAKESQKIAARGKILLSPWFLWIRRSCFARSKLALQAC